MLDSGFPRHFVRCRQDSVGGGGLGWIQNSPYDRLKHANTIMCVFRKTLFRPTITIQILGFGVAGAALQGAQGAPREGRGRPRRPLYLRLMVVLDHLILDICVLYFIRHQ